MSIRVKMRAVVVFSQSQRINYLGTCCLLVKFKSLHEKAKFVDHLIDEYINTKKGSFVPMENMEQIVFSVFPDAHLSNFGSHKLVFRLRYKATS